MNPIRRQRVHLFYRRLLPKQAVQPIHRPRVRPGIVRPMPLTAEPRRWQHRTIHRIDPLPFTQRQFLVHRVVQQVRSLRPRRLRRVISVDARIRQRVPLLPNPPRARLIARRRERFLLARLDAHERVLERASRPVAHHPQRRSRRVASPRRPSRESSPHLPHDRPHERRLRPALPQAHRVAHRAQFLALHRRERPRDVLARVASQDAREDILSRRSLKLRDRARRERVVERAHRVGARLARARVVGRHRHRARRVAARRAMAFARRRVVAPAWAYVVYTTFVYTVQYACRDRYETSSVCIVDLSLVRSGRGENPERRRRRGTARRAIDRATPRRARRTRARLDARARPSTRRARVVSGSGSAGTREGRTST